MSRIGIMGGTFDPVHLGHTNLAISATEEMGLSKVILVPAYIQPFKKDRFVSSGDHRLEMLRLATLGIDIIEISTWEMDKGGVSYTYDTLTYFSSEFPKDEIWFILGSDSFLKLEKWYKGKELLRSTNFIVGLREEDDSGFVGNESKRLSEIYNNKIEILNKTMLPFSSTCIRERIENEESISGIVAPEVEEYIYEQKLYI